MRSGINMIIFGFALLCAASDEGCFCAVPCGGANHAPPEMVSGNAIALCCICYSIRKGHKQLADFSGGNWDFRLLLLLGKIAASPPSRKGNRPRRCGHFWPGKVNFPRRSAAF